MNCSVLNLDLFIFRSSRSAGIHHRVEGESGFTENLTFLIPRQFIRVPSARSNTSATSAAGLANDFFGFDVSGIVRA